MTKYFPFKYKPNDFMPLHWKLLRTNVMLLIITKTTHHPTNKKPHEGGVF